MTAKHYDFLIVGSGLFGAVCAYELGKKGKTCLVIDKRSHIGGNLYTECLAAIHVHHYGAHIFHTNNLKIWNYINKFGEFNNYINAPVARFHDELYNLPFNMNTFTKLWPDVITPADAAARIASEREAAEIDNPQNLQEQAISMVGTTIFEKLVKGYTEKQWGRPCSELPAFIIKRLPVRYTFDNNYFNDRYQGIPINGYTNIIEKMLAKAEVQLNCDFFKQREKLTALADQIIYTGPIDQFYDYRFGTLAYRSLRFETEILNQPNFQGNAVINYTANDVPYTRIIEHKHFVGTGQPQTVITREYPLAWAKGREPYYPINDQANNALYERYRELADAEINVHFGGRLAQYQYLNMDKVIEAALELTASLLKKTKA